MAKLRRNRKRLRRRKVNRRMRRTKRKSSIYKRPHFFERSLDWSQLYQSQGASFDGSFGLSAQFSAGCTAIFTGDILTITVAPATNGYASFALSPMMRSLPDYLEFTSLFDMYKIRGFSTKIMALQNNFQATSVGGPTGGTTIGSAMTILHTCMDWDDNTVFHPDITGTNAMREFLTYRWKAMNGNRIHKLYCSKPGVLLQAQETTGVAINVPAMIKRSPLLDCGQVGIQHHSQKFIFEAANLFSTTSSIYVFKVESKIWINLVEPR